GGVRSCEIGIKLDGPGEQLQCFLDAFFGRFGVKGQASEIIVIGIEALRGLARRTLKFCLLNLGSDCRDNASRHSILQVEDVLKYPVKVVGPEMRAGRCVDQLAGDPDLASGPANAAFEHIADTKLPTDLLYVDRLAFVGE